MNSTIGRIRVREGIEIPVAKRKTKSMYDFFLNMESGDSVHLGCPGEPSRYYRPLEGLRQFAHRRKIPIAVRTVDYSDPDGRGIRVWKL